MSSSQADNNSHVQDFRRFVQQQSQQGTLGATAKTDTANSRFLPEKVLYEYFDDLHLLNLLKAVVPFDGHPPVQPRTIRERFAKVFAILLCIGYGNFIKLFAQDDDLSDKKLPFTNCPTAFPRVGVSDEQFFTPFYNQQWMFCVPPLTYEPRSRWPARRILPIIKKRQIGDGGSAKTYKIEVHPDYNQLSPKNASTSTNIFVLKTFKPNDLVDSYEKEVRAFLALQSNTTRDPCIIGFYGSYIHGDSCNLILEYANEGTLGDYLQKYPPPTTRQDIYRFWNGLLGLIKALKAIHCIISGDSNTTLRGWHQDIKPCNILVSRRNHESLYECEFKLADLGLSHIDVKVGENAQCWSVQGTRTYGPPECYRSEPFTATSRLPSSQIADIWSLGAVLSEAAVWLHGGGIPGIRGYMKLRTKETEGISEFKDVGCFHNGESVLLCVETTHEALRKNAQGRDTLTGPVLSMIEMMLAPSQARLSATQCSFKAKKVLDGARSMIDDSYNGLRNSTLPPKTSTPLGQLNTSLDTPNGTDLNGALTPPLATSFPTLPNLSVDRAREWRNMRRNHRAGFRDNFLPDYHHLGETKNRDHVFVLDDSSSMYEHWDNALDLLDTLAYLVKPSDPDGLELCFTINDKRFTRKHSSDLVKMAERACPRGSGRLSNISIILGSILEGYEKRLKEPAKGWFNKKEVRKMSIYIFTDGVWRPQTDAAGPIKSLISALDELHKPKNQIGIQFIQFGNDMEGHERLTHLDSKMGLSRDIVDTELCNGNVWKMLLGAIDPWFDSDISSCSEAMLPPTPPG
ncbi:kinase-like protein [Glonium stellatum]|uniref:Kinase-like protein n=1 Tax=Glonium stellatum TaxID=574774 RepID=A0A8E2FCG4_9PEZI|nr:kinase-like protein [Glonium stellatum]